MPSLATPSKSPRSCLLPKLDALILAARRLPVSKNSLPMSAAPDLAVPETSVSKIITPRAFMRTYAVRRSDPLSNLQLVGVQGLFVEQLRTRLAKSYLNPPPLALAVSHRSRTSLVAQILAAQKSSWPTLKALAPMLAALLLCPTRV